MVLKRKLALVNKTEYNVYIFLVLACFAMTCITIAGVFIPETRAAIVPSIMMIFGLALKYVNFKGIKNPDEEELSEEEEFNLAKIIPQKTLENLFAKHVSPPASNTITPSNSNDQIKNPAISDSTSVTSVTSEENK